MPGLADKQPSDTKDPFTAGCLLLLVLVADVASGLLVVIVLAVRGLGRMDTGLAQTAANPPSADWTPLLWLGALALAMGVTGVVLLRLGHRFIGAVQLALCLLLTCCAPATWP
ncbi:inner-membrane translocator [Streptomyces sp. NPDC047085]|uniref:inner-membrane translocator n=1 Tax=Streptomyces sp. NPDC047085 TaxID=3155140 RepID=UPI0033EC4961